MHIVMATVGTRGDAQPYVALGAELIRRGHRVTMATHDDHRALAESRGLGFRSVSGSFRAVVETPAGRAWLESSDSPTRYVSAFRACFEPLVDAWLADFDAALADCDAVLAHSFAMGALVAGSRRKLPMALLSPFAVVPSGEHSLLGLPRIPLLGPWLERTLFRKFFDDVWTVAHAGIARYLAQHGERPPAGSYRASLLARGVRHLHLASPAIFPRPTDWPECAEVTGFCFLDALPTWKPPARLAEFLAEGPPPIYIGFGSMTGMAPAALSALTRKAVEAAKVRAVVGMGWGGIEGLEGSERLCVVEDVPHDWLMPRVAAAVHHAGAGTTAAVLRAGKPSFGVPFFGDQPWWSSRLARLGTGPAPIPKRRLTAERLTEAIVAVTSVDAYRARAGALGETIRAERGVEVTADRALAALGA
jgi:sterol 3beta-glucosyltransferase